MDVALIDSGWFELLLFFSFLGNLFIALVIYFNPKLQVHPMKLFMLTGFSDACFFYNQMGKFIICDCESYKLFTWLTRFSALWPDYYKSFKILIEAQGFWLTFTWVLSLGLNICLCIDLILMLAMPFEKKEPRIKKYFIGSFIAACLMGILKLFINNATAYLWLNWIEMFAYFTFVVFAIGSSVYAIQKLRQPGVSKEVRFLIVRRHVIFIAFYLLSNVFFVMSNIHIIVIHHNKDANVSDNWVVEFFCLLFFGSGILMPIMRLAEPYFYSIAIRSAKDFLEYLYESQHNIRTRNSTVGYSNWGKDSFRTDHTGSQTAHLNGTNSADLDGVIPEDEFESEEDSVNLSYEEEKSAQPQSASLKERNKTTKKTDSVYQR